MQLHKNLAFISLFFSIFCMITNVILYGFNYHNDLLYYYHFISDGYNFGSFTFIPVLYFPHFYFLFYPFSFIPISVMYCLIGSFICYAIYKMILMIHDISELSQYEKYIITFFIMIDSAIESSWCNMEIICLFVYMYIMQDVMRTKKIGFFQIFWLAIFSFKIVSILHFIYILIYVKNHPKIEVFTLYFSLIGLMCFPYLLIDNSLLSFQHVIFLVQHSNPSLTNQYIIQRNTFLIPVVLLITKSAKIIWKKVKK